MLDTVQTYGMWGYGIVGRSTVAYLVSQGCSVVVYDASDLGAIEGATVETDLQQFLETCDRIIPSGAIDLRPYKQYQHKWLPELDLFQTLFYKPIIALTGTLGKTTVTYILSAALRAFGERVFVGGNIGRGLCDALVDQGQWDCAVVECSSFQLEQCKVFAPDIAVITNLFPNHLDRHDTLQTYWAAKYNIVANQKSDGVCIAAPDLLDKLPAGTRGFVPLPDIISVPSYGLPEHWAIVYSVLRQRGYSDQDIARVIANDLQTPPTGLAHRMERVAVIDGVTYINDSKATVIEATVAAVKSCAGRRILLLGGLSKGVNREAAVRSLVQQVDTVVCFGAEAEMLASWLGASDLDNANRVIVACDLESAIDHAREHARQGDTILFSPGGSSFDLFKNFAERGDVFRAYVQRFC